MSQPEPLQFFLMAIVFVPKVAGNDGLEILKAPPLTEYSMLQVPVPPPLSVTFKERSCPSQTVVVDGIWVPDGADGSATTVQE